MGENMVCIYKCPVCNNRLVKGEAQYCCENRHSFDIGHNNYVNLLIDNQKKSKDPGDSKEMMESRRKFLNGEFYELFSNSLNQIISECINNNDMVILDAGCGEGYFLTKLKEYIEKSLGFHNVGFYGVDISKTAVKYAAKRDKQANFIVGSNYKLPVTDKSVDIVIRNFAPGDGKEFHRILKDDGILIIVTPGEEHLFELKEQLYEKARKHEIKENGYSEFKLDKHHEIKYSIELDNNDDIKNLITMTPYYWSIHHEVRENLYLLKEIKTRLHFNVDIFNKINSNEV